MQLINVSFHFCFIVVNKIKQNRDVTINIPDETHGSAIIRIEGNKHGVEEAKAVSSFMNCISYCTL